MNMSRRLHTNQKETNPNFIFSATKTNRELPTVAHISSWPLGYDLCQQWLFFTGLRQSMKFYINQTQELLTSRHLSVVEARTKKAQSTDGYSKGKGGEPQFYNNVLCWKEAGHDKEK